MESKYLLPDWLYQWLKWTCLLLLPTLGWVYGSLAPDWGWPMAEQIVHTLDVVGTAIGILIGLSEAKARFGRSDEDA